ncbi:MAG: anti-phage protein KwaA [Candidatus Thiodiazotropha endolucinida]
MKLGEMWDKFELYVMSLWLLFFLIIVLTANIPICFEENCSFIGLEELLLTNIIPSVSLFFLILGAIFYFRFDYRISGSKQLPSEVVEAEDYNYEHLTFLTTYIIPLICFDLTSARYVSVLGFLLIVIGIIYVKTDKFYANPTLAVLGFRLYKVNLKSRTGMKNNIVVITKHRLTETNQVNTLYLDEKVCFARKVQ